MASCMISVEALLYDSCTVVLQHLLPSIQQPEEWDVLIGHYLGVDHVGHTFDVHTQHMRAKLLQMNQHVARVRHLAAYAE